MMPRIYFLLLALAGLLIARPAAAQLYDVRPGDVNYNKGTRAALKVQVDGKATDVREYFQDWMKSSYNVKFKSGGVLGMGKSDVIVAHQTPASPVSGKLVDLYASFVAPSDSVTEVVVFGGFDDHTFFDPSSTKTEYDALRAMVQNFAGATRLKAYREMIAEAEKKLKSVEKEKERLEKEQAYLKTNTASNLTRIEELKKEKRRNLTQSRTDSASQIKNASLLQDSRLRLQRRRDRLSALDRKTSPAPARTQVMENPASPLDTLRQLKEMLDAGALTPTEFEAPEAAAGVQRVGPRAARCCPTQPRLRLQYQYQHQYRSQLFRRPRRSSIRPMFEDGAANETPIGAPPVAARPTEFVSAPFVPPGLPVAPVTPVFEPILESESKPNWAAANSFPGLTEEPPARNPLALILSIGGVLVFLAVVAYLSVNRPPSEHISSTSQTEADSLALAAPIETGPQAELLPQPVAVPETVRVAPTNPAPVIQPRPMPARDSAATAPATVKRIQLPANS